MDAQIAEVKKALGKALSGRRAYRVLTQAELSEKSGVEEKHILKLEKGEHLPTLETLFKLCIALDVKPSELLTSVQEVVNPKWKKTKIPHTHHKINIGHIEEVQVIRPQKNVVNNPKSSMNDNTE